VASEGRVSATVEHADEFPGDFLLAQEHGEHLHAEELLQVFELEFRGDPGQSFPVNAAVRTACTQTRICGFLWRYR